MFEGTAAHVASRSAEAGALLEAAGGTRIERRVILRDPTPAEAVLTVHLPVMLGTEGEARPSPASNSGDFIGLQRSSGFVTIPPGPTVAIAGSEETHSTPAAAGTPSTD